MEGMHDAESRSCSDASSIINNFGFFFRFCVEGQDAVWIALETETMLSLSNVWSVSSDEQTRTPVLASETPSGWGTRQHPTSWVQEQWPQSTLTDFLCEPHFAIRKDRRKIRKQHLKPTMVRLKRVWGNCAKRRNHIFNSMATVNTWASFIYRAKTRPR